MLKLIICMWLPGSGKTTYALQEVDKNPYGVVRVNKDDLRAMCSNSHYSKDLESLILEIRDTIITESLMSGKHVIVDDTNLNLIHIERFKQIAKTLAHKNVKIEIKDFRYVPIEECIRRDAKRDKPVGEAVIRKMAQDFMKHYKPEDSFIIIQDNTKPAMLIVDIDGTVACKSDRSPYDYSRVMEDTPHTDIISLLQTLAIKYRIWFVTWREETCKDETTAWLAEHIPFKYSFLKMRSLWDTRWDQIVKHEIAQQIVKDWYIAAVFDDRNRVVDMWRKAGIRCLQVAPWNF